MGENFCYFPSLDFCNFCPLEWGTRSLLTKKKVNGCRKNRRNAPEELKGQQEGNGSSCVSGTRRPGAGRERGQGASGDRGQRHKACGRGWRCGAVEGRGGGSVQLPVLLTLCFFSLEQPTLIFTRMPFQYIRHLLGFCSCISVAPPLSTGRPAGGPALWAAVIQ